MPQQYSPYQQQVNSGQPIYNPNQVIPKSPKKKIIVFVIVIIILLAAVLFFLNYIQSSKEYIPTIESGKIGSKEEYYIRNIEADYQDNIYITGFFSFESLNFGKDSSGSDINLYAPNYKPNESKNSFLVKYNLKDTTEWVKLLPDLDVSSMDIDERGNIYVIGNYEYSDWVLNSSPEFQEMRNKYYSFRVNPDNLSLYSIPYVDTMIFKYNTEGVLLWEKIIKYGDGGSIKVDRLGNIYVDGIFSLDSVEFGKNAIDQNITLKNPSFHPDYYAFIAKFNQDGNIIWANRYINTGISNDENTIDIDNFGNIYLTGEVDGGDFFGYNSEGKEVFLTKGSSHYQYDYRDTYTLKYNQDGIVDWVKKSGDNSNSEDFGTSISVDDKGNVYTTGGFYVRYPHDDAIKPIIFFDGLSNNPETNKDYKALEMSSFIVKYDSNGNALWLKDIHGDSAGGLIVTDNKDSIYVANYFLSKEIILDDGTNKEAILKKRIDNHPYIVKYGVDGSFKWVKTINSIANHIEYKNGDNIYLDGLDFLAKYNSQGDLIWSKDISKRISVR